MAGQRGVRAGRAFVELGVRDRLSAGLRRAQKRLKAFGAGVRNIGLKLVAAGAAALIPLGIAIKVFAKAGDELEKMSRRTGITVEALSELGFAAEQSGADLETLEKGVKTMQRAIVDLGRGLSTQVDAFGALGLTLEDLQNLNPEAQLKLIADRLSKVTDATTRAALAAQLLGRAGTRLLPLFEDGAAGMEKLQEEARRLGLTISTKTAKDAARLTDAFNIVRKVLKVTAITIGAALAPAMEKISTFVTRVVIVTNAWIKKNKQLVVTIFKVAIGVVAAGAALLVLSLAIGLIGFVFGGLAAIVTVVGGVISAVGAVLGAIVSPIGLVVAAIVLATAAFLKFSGVGQIAIDFLKEKFASLSAIVGKTLGGIRDALAAGDIGLAAKVLWVGIKLAFLDGTKEIREIFAEGMTFIRKTWSISLGAMLGQFAIFSSGTKVLWEKLQDFLNKRRLDFMALSDPSLDVEAISNALDKSSNARVRAIQTELIDSLNEIDDETKDRTKSILDDAANKMQEQKDALIKAKKELEQAIDDARNKRGAADAADAGGKSLVDRFKSLQSLLDEAGAGLATAASKTETRGTFNASAIQGLAGASRSADRTADATEESVKQLRRIDRRIETSSIAFG